MTISDTAALMLGPFAVEAAYRSLGLGAALIEKACQAAATAGHRVVLLVGDEAYFAPLGFSAGPIRRVVLPGPVDQRRVLIRALTLGAADGLDGAVGVPRVDSGQGEPHQSALRAAPAASHQEALPSGV